MAGLCANLMSPLFRSCWVTSRHPQYLYIIRLSHVAHPVGFIEFEDMINK